MTRRSSRLMSAKPVLEPSSSQEGERLPIDRCACCDAFCACSCHLLRHRSADTLSTLVDYVPLLRYMPGYASIGKRWHADELALFKGQLDIVKAAFDAHDAQPCFATHLLERPDDYGLSYDEMACACPGRIAQCLKRADLCGSFFGAGSDTSAAGTSRFQHSSDAPAISVALMAAAVTPAAQDRVQDELDRVVGRSRSTQDRR